MNASGKRIVAATVAATVLLLGHTGVDAHCPALTPKVCSTFFRSEAVFLATVLSETRVVSSDDVIEGWRYRVRVKRSFRGSTTGTVEVYTENTSARRPLNVGRDYLLFANTADGQLLIASDCGAATDEARLRTSARSIACRARRAPLSKARCAEPHPATALRASR
jgi:hypothetical protein